MIGEFLKSKNKNYVKNINFFHQSYVSYVSWLNFKKIYKYKHNKDYFTMYNDNTKIRHIYYRNCHMGDFETDHSFAYLLY